MYVELQTSQTERKRTFMIQDIHKCVFVTSENYFLLDENNMKLSYQIHLRTYDVQMGIVPSRTFLQIFYFIYILTVKVTTLMLLSHWSEPPAEPSYWLTRGDPSKHHQAGRCCNGRCSWPPGILVFIKFSWCIYNGPMKSIHFTAKVKSKK